MQDFELSRQNMVDCQIRTSDVTAHRVLSAFQTVPRERFVPSNMAELAYIDEDIEVADDRYVMEPAPFAKLVQAAAIGSEDVVLDIGCGTGYSSAVLSRFASLVIALEEDPDLAKTAAKTLADLDYDNVAVVEGPLNKGYAAEGPYDVIFVGGCVDVVPAGLFEQLREGGKLVVVEGAGNTGTARLYLRSGEDISGRRLFNCAVKPLPGFQKKAEFAL
jgi:protein-L-isoaspartate(D-aspartate) O-methyltransferase